MCLMEAAGRESTFVCDVGNHSFMVTNACVYSGVPNRTIYSGSFGTLGSALPKAIGACCGTGRPVVCFAGDQGLQMNIQELQFIAQHRLPVTVVVINNLASAMIREREVKQFSHLVHTTPESGYSVPDLRAVANAYGLNYRCVEDPAALAQEDIGLPDVEVHGTRRWHLSRMDHIADIKDRIIWHDCNMLDATSVRKVIREVQPDIVFHMAAESFVSPSWDNPREYMDTNYLGTVNFLDAIREIKPDTKFHIPGSGEEYGDIHPDELPINEFTVLRPVNPYAVTKVAQDLIGYVYFRSYNTLVYRTRTFNHEGPRRENVFGIASYAYQIARIEKGLQEPVVRIGDTSDKRNFTRVKDIVRAYWLAVHECEPGELYLIGSNENDKVYTFQEALEKLIVMSTVPGITWETDPQFVRPTKVPYLIGDTSKFRNITGWKPEIGFQEILEDTLNYWRKKV